MQSTIVGVASIVGMTIGGMALGVESVVVVKYFAGPKQEIVQPVDCEKYKLYLEHPKAEKDEILDKQCFKLPKEDL